MPHLTIRTSIATLALPAALLLAACGGSSHTPSNHTPAASTPAASSPATTPTGSSSTGATGKTGTHHAGKTKASAGGSKHHGSGSSTAPTGGAGLGPSPLHPNTAAVGGCPHGTGPCLTKNTSVKPAGSPYIDLNLQRAIVGDHPTIKQAAVRCPSPSGYPFTCKLTGRAQVAGNLVSITGTVKVVGLEVRSRTYAYALEYSPVKSG
jgi:hypothetical protein